MSLLEEKHHCSRNSQIKTNHNQTEYSQNVKESIISSDDDESDFELAENIFFFLNLEDKSNNGDEWTSFCFKQNFIHIICINNTYTYANYNYYTIFFFKYISQLDPFLELIQKFKISIYAVFTLEPIKYFGTGS